MNSLTTNLPSFDRVNAYLPSIEATKTYAKTAAIKLGVLSGICYAGGLTAAGLGFMGPCSIPGSFIQASTITILDGIVVSTEKAISPKIQEIIPANIHDSQVAKNALKTAKVALGLAVWAAGEKAANHAGYETPFYLPVLGGLVLAGLVLGAVVAGYGAVKAIDSIRKPSLAPDTVEPATPTESAEQEQLEQPVAT